MKISARVAFMCVFVATAIVPKAAFAILPPPVPVQAAAGASAGVAVTGGFLGFVGALALYDIIRRVSCSGDPLGLGGPGFSSPMTAAMTVLPPQCAFAQKHNRHR